VVEARFEPADVRVDGRLAAFFAGVLRLPALADDPFLGEAFRGAALVAPAFLAGAAPERAGLRPDAPERRAVDLVAMADSLVGNCHSYLICNTRIGLCVEIETLESALG
jgi:hypothetical protein